MRRAFSPLCTRGSPHSLLYTEITNIEEVASANSSSSNAAASGGAGGGEKPLAPRKERTKSRDMGKRMGGGQKGVWGKPEEVLTPVAAVDDNDPNYDSEGEDNVILVSTLGSPVKKAAPVNLAPDALAAKELAVNPPPDVKKRIIEIIDEYLISADSDEVKRCVGVVAASELSLTGGC